MLSQFGVTLLGTTTYGPGVILASHRITSGLTSVFIGKNGYFTTPSSALHLIADRLAYIAAAVMERTPETGQGRLFVIGDHDMFTDPYLQTYPENVPLAENIASWALVPYPTIHGRVTLPGYQGNTAGLPVTIRLFDGNTLIGSYATVLDSGGNYSLEVPHSGRFDVVAKPWRWLARKQSGVLVAGRTQLDWLMVYNGDVTDDNRIELGDLSAPLVQFSRTGNQSGDVDGSGVVDLSDLAIILVNFGKTGD